MEHDIHAPTVPSGPTTNGTTNGAPAAPFPLARLMEEKDRLEGELKALGSLLDSHGVTMTTSLLTFDGFPRSDIDVAMVRTARSRINHLKTDYKAVMIQLEKALHQHFADQASNTASSNGSPSASIRMPYFSLESYHPFARVNTVAPDSPASDATLRPGDLICKFGDATRSNHERLARIASIVQGSGEAGSSISVTIQREGVARNLVLELRPRSGWGGRGMLGCHIVPL